MTIPAGTRLGPYEILTALGAGTPCLRASVASGSGKRGDSRRLAARQARV
jgi:hypothetical protein